MIGIQIAESHHSMPRTKSLEVLQRKIRELTAKAEQLEQAEKPGIVQLRAVLRKYKLGPADVKRALGDGGKRPGSSLNGPKVKPKYRNPKNRSETWTGRGRMPLWMVALIKQGKKPTDFLIHAD